MATGRSAGSVSSYGTARIVGRDSDPATGVAGVSFTIIPAWLAHKERAEVETKKQQAQQGNEEKRNQREREKERFRITVQGSGNWKCSRRRSGGKVEPPYKVLAAVAFCRAMKDNPAIKDVLLRVYADTHARTISWRPNHLVHP